MQNALTKHSVCTHIGGGNPSDGNAASATGGDITGPEERLAFALSDGRVGVLAVKGRKVCVTSPICHAITGKHYSHRRTAATEGLAQR